MLLSLQRENYKDLKQELLVIEQYAKETQCFALAAVQTLDEGFEDAMTIMYLPMKYRQTLRTSNIVERENREIRKREKVIQIFPNVSNLHQFFPKSSQKNKKIENINKIIEENVDKKIDYVFVIFGQSFSKEDIIELVHELFKSTKL